MTTPTDPEPPCCCAAAPGGWGFRPGTELIVKPIVRPLSTREEARADIIETLRSRHLSLGGLRANTLRSETVLRAAVSELMSCGTITRDKRQREGSRGTPKWIYRLVGE